MRGLKTREQAMPQPAVPDPQQWSLICRPCNATEGANRPNFTLSAASMIMWATKGKEIMNNI